MGSPNYSEGRPIPPFALVIHTMGGSLAGTDSWFATADSQVSSHYGVGLGGAKHAYVALPDQAWVNGVLEPGNRWGRVLDVAGVTAPWARGLNPNAGTVGVETEDMGNAAVGVPDAQYEAVLEVCLEALYYQPSLRVVTTHSVISPSSRAGCAGRRWTAGPLARLAHDLGLALVV